MEAVAIGLQPRSKCFAGLFALIRGASGPGLFLEEEIGREAHEDDSEDLLEIAC